jgi:hypothetical protein
MLPIVKDEFTHRGEYWAEVVENLRYRRYLPVEMYAGDVGTEAEAEGSQSGRSGPRKRIIEDHENSLMIE